jgi:hypothetical protein
MYPKRGFPFAPDLVELKAILDLPAEYGNLIAV